MCLDDNIIRMLLIDFAVLSLLVVAVSVGFAYLLALLARRFMPPREAKDVASEEVMS